jgi:hypothetical protein
MAAISGWDLANLATIAEQVHDRLLERSESARESGALLARALCQGGARHLCDGKTGVKDWDVWSFYPEGRATFPARWHGHAVYLGRPVDLFGRTLPVLAGTDPAQAIVDWLMGGRGSARYLAEDPVVLIWPPERSGEVVWWP